MCKYGNIFTASYCYKIPIRNSASRIPFVV